MKSALPLLLLALTAVLPGCFMSRSKLNKPLEPDAVGRLIPGKHTADDVLLVLGAPLEVVQLGRRAAWRYDYIQTKRAGLTFIVVTFINEDAKMDRTWVFFDEQDNLTHIGSTFEADEAEFGMPWQDDGPEGDEPQEGEPSAQAEPAETSSE